MKEQILDFAEQFRWEPIIENAGKMPKADRFLVCGMGGSALSGDLLKVFSPKTRISVHRDYGLPEIDGGTFVIASSYSGNTEETLDAYSTALKSGRPLVAIASGGKLLEMAQKDGVSYIQIPPTGIQPRMALGYGCLALLEIIGNERTLKEMKESGVTLDPAGLENKGQEVAERIRDKIPVIYSSARNGPIAYVWKIKFNETGKIPAFCNILSELNHNEMTGFDVKDATRHLSERFHFIFLRDDTDHPQIQKRMAVLERLYGVRGLPVASYQLQGKSLIHKLFSALLVADWAAYYTAEAYGLESEQVPMVEEFKKEIG